MLKQALGVAEAALSANNADDASRAFYGSVASLGATYLQTRIYRRPTSPLTSATHFAAGGVVTRISTDSWPGSPGFNYICFDCNPLLDAIKEGRTRYRFSDFAPHDQVRYGPYWEAFSEAGIKDALCATSYGRNRAIASLHLGFNRKAFTSDEAMALQMAGLMLTEHLIGFAEPPGEEVKLTDRERDALAWVAEGKSDWEIGKILAVSETTVRFHVDNGRRKLGAVNRAQAVARLAAAGLL